MENNADNSPNSSQVVEENEEEKKKLIQVQVDNFNLRQRVTMLESHIVLVKRRYNEQKQQLDAAPDNSILVIKQKTEILSLQETIKGERKKYEKLEKKCNNLSDELGKCQRENKKLRRRPPCNEEEGRKVQELRNKLKEKKNKIEELEAALKAERDQRNFKKETTAKKLKETEDRLEILENSGLAKDEEICQYQVEIEQQKGEIREFERRYEKYVQRQNKNTAGLRQQLEDILEKHASTVREYDSLKQTYENDKKVLAEQLLQLNEAKGIMLHQQELLTKQDEKMMKLELKKAPLESTIQEQQAHIEELSKERDLLVTFVKTVKVGVQCQEPEETSLAQSTSLAQNMEGLIQKWTDFVEENKVQMEVLQEEATKAREKCETACKNWEAAENELNLAQNIMIQKDKEFDETKNVLSQTQTEMKLLTERHAQEKSTWESVTVANQGKIKKLMEERGNVKRFLEKIKILSDFQKRPHVSLSNQLSELCTHLGSRLGLVTSFCNLAKSVEAQIQSSSPSSSTSSSIPPATVAPETAGEPTLAEPTIMGSEQAAAKLDNGSVVVPRIAVKTPLKTHGENVHRRITGLGVDGYGARYFCVCGFMCASLSQLEQHISQSNYHTLFQCSDCPLHFLYISHLIQHLSETHGVRLQVNKPDPGAWSSGGNLEPRGIYQQLQRISGNAASTGNTSSSTPASAPPAFTSTTRDSFAMPSLVPAPLQLANVPNRGSQILPPTQSTNVTQVINLE